MKTQRRNFSDDRLTITQHNTRSKKTSVNEIENSEKSIPVDLIIEIFLRLPSKSLARCRFVSKLWDYVFRGPDFTELFMTRSQPRSQLLFAIQKRSKILFFSSPQLQNTDVNSSPIICANELTNFSFDGKCEICGPVNGFVCLIHRRSLNGILNETVLVIFNPTTGQSLPLPKLKTSTAVPVTGYFVYDPIDEQFKVLCMTSNNYERNSLFDRYQILTMGTGKNLSWRMIECWVPPHYSYDRGICIDGVLYYRASVGNISSDSMIICFDVRSEKFSSIRLVSQGNLINYYGKLGSVKCDMYGYVDGGSIELWVLEDAEKMEWSKRTYKLSWQNVPRINYLYFVGMTLTNEIVFVTRRMPFYVVYCNIERKTIMKVGIQGIEAFENTPVHLFLDHVEDVKLM